MNNPKNIVIYLSMSPEEGGKFQYSISFIESACVLKEKGYNIIALYKNRSWIKYLNEFNITSFSLDVSNRSFLSKIKKLITKKMNFIVLWRLIAKWADPIYNAINEFNPTYVCYPGADSLSYELPFNSITPIFDLMHRYEKFDEVSSKTVYKSREHHYTNVCKYCTAILVDSNIGRKHVLDSYNVDFSKIYVLPYVPPNYIYKKINRSILDRYNLFEDFLFYPAQFWSHKNHIIIINAINILKTKYGLIINAVFVGSDKNNLQSIQNEINHLNLNDQIRILGYVPNTELIAFYKKAIALVFPSYFGPTNIPPLEALALDCIIVIADVYANREQLQNIAHYFNPNDSNQLAEIIFSLKNNYCEYKRRFLENKSISGIKKEIYSFPKIDLFQN